MVSGTMNYEVVVIGAGHAGCEAALACARMGLRTLLVTMRHDRIGLMSCNPAIGGLAKGQLVKELDALGGEMAKATDACGIQFRILNSSRGPAVRSSRAQCDRWKYQGYMQGAVEGQTNLTVIEATARELLTKNGEVKGIETKGSEKIEARAVVLAPGTFLNGQLFVGAKTQSGGRFGDGAAIDLSNSLRRLGFKLARLKTGTTPRLDKRTIDFSRLEAQFGDNPPRPFSFSTTSIPQRQVPCYITYTNSETHKIIRDGFDRSPLFTGKIKGRGVRYCPSIEDKVHRFPERERHQIFLEPDGLGTYEYYPNGISTSLPEDIQEKMVRSIEGLREAKIITYGYAVEYDFSDPTQLLPTLETKLIKNLYFAGQINGTTGYEEAASMGLIAGINAALRVKGKPPFVLDRSQAYIGVLIDDLVTKGTDEPYRMFTSRAEYRLILREDNADLRLRKMGYEIGLVGQPDYERTLKKARDIESELARLSMRGLEKRLRQPDVTYRDFHTLPEVEIQIKYQGFIERQARELEKFRYLENIKIPGDFEFYKVPSLSKEVIEKLTKFKPLSLGQASRISGVTPAAISALMVYLKGHF